MKITVLTEQEQLHLIENSRPKTLKELLAPQENKENSEDTKDNSEEEIEM